MTCEFCCVCECNTKLKAEAERLKENMKYLKSKNFVQDNQRLREALLEADRILQHCADCSGRDYITEPVEKSRQLIKAALEGKDG